VGDLYALEGTYKENYKVNKILLEENTTQLSQRKINGLPRGGDIKIAYALIYFTLHINFS
jgi:hypothetical protein